MPATEITAEDFTDGAVGIMDLMVKCKLAASKGEARRLIQQGGVNAKDEKVTDVYKSFTAEDFTDGYIVIKKGKKVFHKAVLK
jgi:tyrosyl-tRNA synthetase